ncbi:MAG TPA: hypothetical protein VNB24_02440 [Acidimicrobiales bacterium]|nr:hypothetical protein [Acidimicrobiales bacterium]
MTAALITTCVWGITPALVIALDDQFGEPLDTYVNGSQVWMREEGPNELVVQWRLHPVASYQRPRGLATEEVFSVTALALAQGEPTAAPLEQLWDGLECFPAYDSGIEPATLAGLAVEALGIPPDAYGLVDHEQIADTWENSRGAISIVAALLAQLRP